MKTEQEQIKKMARTMCGNCSTDGKCAVSKNGREPDICANVDTQHCLYKEYAERLIESGYGKVSEYEAEIKRLKAEFKQLETNAEILARGVRDLNHENYELTEKIKQSQIDVLNELKKYLHTEDFDTPDERWKPESEFCAIIDKLINEVQNAEDKG